MVDKNIIKSPFPCHSLHDPPESPGKIVGKKIAGIIGMSNIKNLHECTFITITSPSSLTQSLCFLGSMLKGPNDYHKVLPYL